MLNSQRRLYADEMAADEEKIVVLRTLILGRSPGVPRNTESVYEGTPWHTYGMVDSIILFRLLHRNTCCTRVCICLSY